MHGIRSAIAVCVALAAVPMCHAAGQDAGDSASRLAVLSTSVSSSSSSSAASSAAAEPAMTGWGAKKKQRIELKTGVEPFSRLAVQIKLGIGGAGVDLAMPIASRLNLRVGGSFFSYNPNLVEDGIGINGSIQLRSVTENFDFFPFNNGFRISPGVVFYNGNNINATASVAGGSTFTLNGIDYISSPSSPVTGTFGLAFGNQLAPSLTMGFGNMIPRKGGHWRFPVEIGAEYIGKAPRISLALSGVTCQGNTQPANCNSIATDPTTQQNVVAEQQSLNSGIPTQLRFFPIVSFGVSYAFRVGHAESH